VHLRHVPIGEPVFGRFGSHGIKGPYDFWPHGAKDAKEGDV
jgi:hypothetical protein